MLLRLENPEKPPTASDRSTREIDADVRLAILGQRARGSSDVHRVVAQCTQSLMNLETCLDKAEQHAATKKFDVGVLMNSRLA